MKIKVLLSKFFSLAHRRSSKREGKMKKKARRAKEKIVIGKESIAYKVVDSRRNLAILFLFSLCAILIYGNSLHSPFIWDDQYLITENYFIRSFKYIFEIFKHHLYYSSAGISNFYRPLQIFFLMIDYSLWKDNPLGYHITNLIFHILCSFVIYLVINFIFKERTIAFLASLLFLVHPVNSTVVNYISSRADSQASLFILLSLFLFLKYIVATNSKIYFFGSLTSFILALFSKEVAIILPFLLLMTIPFVSSAKKEIFRKTMPFFIILAIYGFLRLTILRFSSPGVSPPSLYIRLLTTSESFVRLIVLLFLPLQIHIEKSIPYSNGLFQPSTIISLITLIAIWVFMFRIRRYSKMCFFGLLWFFATLIPMANIVPINATIADHWLYLPCFGFILGVIGGIADWIKGVDSKIKRQANGLALCIYVLVVIIFSARTIKQNNIWHSPIKFYQLALKFSPKSFRAHNEIGVIYLNQKKYDEAISEFKQAIDINPQFDQAYDNLGVAYDHNGELEKAILQYKKALELSPNNAKVYNNLGNAYNKLNQFDKAIEAYEMALRLNPDYISAYNNLGVIYYKKHMFKKARRYWERALEINPAYEMVIDNLNILKQIKNRRESINK
jgi:Flp pilus assembly protein TadD